MNSPLVKINTATSKEIATLYDIGQQRAGDIVSYREVHGPFHGPEDLAKVEGITPKLAVTLAPHIDWQVSPETEQPKKRDWVSTLFWSTIFLSTTLYVVLYVLMIATALTSPVVRTNFVTGAGAWLKILMAVSGAAILICFAVFAAIRASVALTSDKIQARKSSRRGLLTMAGALGLGLVFFFGMIIYFGFYSRNAWTTLQEAASEWTFIIGLISFVFLFLFTVPQLTVWWRPDLVSNLWLSRIFDTAIGLLGLVLVLSLRANTEFLPLWLLVLISLAGVLLVAMALDAIRHGESFFHASLDFIDSGVLARQEETADAWKTRPNERSPEYEQQRELNGILEAIHRLSLVNAFGRVVIFGVGVWLVQTAIEAIIELYVQGLWKSLFE